MAQFGDYLEDIKKSLIQYYFRVTLLDKDENEIRELTDDIIDGTLNISFQNGSRRTASIKFVNLDNKYTLSPNDDKIWFDNKFKIETGIINDGVEVLFPQGIYVIGEPNLSNNYNSESTTTFELYDKFSYLDGTISGKLENTIYIEKGKNVVTVMEELFQIADDDSIQIAYDIKPLIPEANSFTAPYSFYVDKGQTYFDAMNELCEAIGYTVYFDEEGYPRFEAIINPENEPPVVTFKEDDILKSSLNSRYEVNKLKNSIRVEGITWDDGITHDANAEQTTGSVSISRIGRRSEFIGDDVIYNDTLAQQRANYELDQSTSISETLNISFFPVDNLDVGRVIQVTDSRIGISDGRFQVRQINLPLRKNTQASIDGQRTIEIGV